MTTNENAQTVTPEQVEAATPTRQGDPVRNDRAAISALVLEAMGDAWSDSEEYSALPGVVADLLLTSDWLAAEKAKWQAEALRDAADEVERRRSEPGLVHLDVRYQGYYTGIRSGMESVARLLRDSAEERVVAERGSDDD